LVRSQSKELFGGHFSQLSLALRESQKDLVNQGGALKSVVETFTFQHATCQFPQLGVQSLERDFHIVFSLLYWLIHSQNDRTSSPFFSTSSLHRDFSLGQFCAVRAIYLWRNAVVASLLAKRSDNAAEPTPNWQIKSTTDFVTVGGLNAHSRIHPDSDRGCASSPNCDF
jgi:hypothetical protein